MARTKKQNAEQQNAASYERNIAARFAVLTQGFLDAMEQQGPLRFIREPLVKSGERGFEAAYKRERARYEDAIAKMKKCEDGDELSLLIAQMHESGTRMVSIQIFENAGPARLRVQKKEEATKAAAHRALTEGTSPSPLPVESVPQERQ